MKRIVPAVVLLLLVLAPLPAAAQTFPFVVTVAEAKKDDGSAPAPADYVAVQLYRVTPKGPVMVGGSSGSADGGNVIMFDLEAAPSTESVVLYATAIDMAGAETLRSDKVKVRINKAGGPTVYAPLLLK